VTDAAANVPMSIGAVVREARTRRSLSLGDVAIRVRRAAAREGRSSRATRHVVHKWERRGTIPRADSLRWLAEALDVPIDVMVAAAGRRP
jgi:transcriptional regulator with XRE-family HTH domain